VERIFQPNTVAYLLLISVFLSGSQSAQAQQCPNAPTCRAVFRSVVLPTGDVPLRLSAASAASPDGKFTDNAIVLSYNRGWDPGSAWFEDNLAFPAASLGFESYWNGHSEMNVDLFQPKTGNALRPLGLSAAYDGSIVQLGIGGSPYAGNAAGLMLSGGNGLLPSLLDMTDQNGRSPNSSMLRMLRQDGTASVAWRAGGIPRVNFALQKNYDASAFGNYGVLKFAGEWDFGEPILEFEAVGASATLLQAYPAPSDLAPRVSLRADGLIRWGSGGGAADTDLYRSGVATLHTDGSLIVGGNLAVMGQKAALVATASYGQRAVYAVESPGEWFEDFGSARLVGTQAIVKIDPVFGETVRTDRQYHVFLTPSGRCSLYVADKRPAFFKVKRQAGLRGCAFDYRLVAKRRGYENVRLAQIPGAPATERK
jgi:hypothetical protein